MDAVNDPSVKSIVVMKSAQTGWTEILNNIAGYFVDMDPCPVLVVQPTETMAEAWSKDRLAPMIRDTPALRKKISDEKSRSSGNTILHKTFPGGHLTMIGANAPSGLASRPIRAVLADEIDRYPVSAGQEGDPLNLAKKRTAAFWNRITLEGGTPTVKGISRIERSFEQSDQRRFFVPCPHCDEYQVLKWTNVKWPDGKPEEAYYVCDLCGSVLTDADKIAMVEKGEWRPTAQGIPGVAGFHIWEAYSPFSSFGDIATNFIKAKDDPTTLKTWVNTSLGETWEEEGERVDDSSLSARREEYSANGSLVPYGVLVLTAGVDIQEDRIELEIKGWGVGEESWGIDYRVLWGDTSQPQVWQSLDDILFSSWKHMSGLVFHLSAVFIDSGYRTQEVYAYVKPRQARRVFATKGIAGAGRPIISSPARKRTGKEQRPVDLFTIGVDEAKGILFSRLRKTEKGPGYYHFPAHYDEEYFLQLTAEKVVTRFQRGFPIREWVKTRPRNEALDINVLAYAALKLLNPVWDALAARIPNKQRAEAAADNEKRPIEPVRRGRRIISKGIEL
jgi:phage terminase large subunit GpA-like protein